ncbi:transcriptional regulator [Aliikangiella maris]|uniref:Winged helix-turn-helix domain-containing protein n=2 Tax=Aliikangiella maris TaxID=3162458 RepID=A0ABV3MQK8_9GAMM
MEIYQSDTLSINPETGMVNTSAGSERIGPVNMRVLICLIEQQGQVVSRNELFQAVWTNQVVSDDVLTRCIADLRKLLRKHNSTIQYIETIPKRGYRWVQQTQKSKVSAHLGDLTQHTSALQNAGREEGDDVASFAAEFEPVTVDDTLTKSKVSNKALSTENSPSTIEVNAQQHDWPDEQSMREATGELDKETKKTDLPVKYKNKTSYSLTYWQVALMGFVTVLLLSTGSLWLVKQWVATPTTKVALLPFTYENDELKSLALEIEEQLTAALISQSGIQVLARSAYFDNTQSPYPYLVGEFGTQWILEGTARHYSGKNKLTITLVDATSATVFASFSREITTDKTQQAQFVSDFIIQSILPNQTNSD